MQLLSWNSVHKVILSLIGGTNNFVAALHCYIEVLEYQKLLSEIHEQLYEKTSKFEDDYGAVTPAEYEELQESLEELEQQRNDIEGKLENTEDTELEELLEEIEYKIKVVEDQMESFNLDEGDPDSALYTDANEFIDNYLRPNDFEVPVGWRLRSIDKNAVVQQKCLNSVIQSFEEFFGLALESNFQTTFDQQQVSRLIEILQDNEVARNRLKEIIDTHLENDFDLNSLEVYLTKHEKKNILNI